MPFNYCYCLLASPAATVWCLFQFHQSRHKKRRPLEVDKRLRASRDSNGHHTFMKQWEEGRTSQSEHSADESRREVM